MCRLWHLCCFEFQVVISLTRFWLQAPWHAVVASADFMLHDVQNESFAEQLRERRRLYQEQGKEIDFFLVPEPAWLNKDRMEEADRVRRPSLALVSQDKQWITCAPCPYLSINAVVMPNGADSKVTAPT